MNDVGSLPGLTASVPLSNIEQLTTRISDLQEKLQKVAPGYESLLHTIHVALVKDPDMVHMLTEEQVGIIVAGLNMRKNILIAEPEKLRARTKTASGKSMKDLGLEDL